MAERPLDPDPAWPAQSPDLDPVEDAWLQCDQTEDGQSQANKNTGADGIFEAGRGKTWP